MMTMAFEWEENVTSQANAYFAMRRETIDRQEEAVARRIRDAFAEQHLCPLDQLLDDASPAEIDLLREVEQRHAAEETAWNTLAEYDQIDAHVHALRETIDLRMKLAEQWDKQRDATLREVEDMLAREEERTRKMEAVYAVTEDAFNLLDEFRTFAARLSYQDYLRSPWWKRRRLRALHDAGNRCQLCNSASRLEVHHRTYDRKGREEPGDLIVLCRPCHAKFHDKIA